MITAYREQLLEKAVAMHDSPAKDAAELGFMARAMVLATLPHKKPNSTVFERRNGNYTLRIITTDPNIGLPYGSLPRLLLAWLTTEAVRTKSPVITLGHNLSEFMRALGLNVTGGKRGDITRLRDQTKRLLCSVITVSHTSTEPERRETAKQLILAEVYDLWLPRGTAPELTQWNSTVTLSTTFYEEIVKSPVPIDMRALDMLKRSPLALDLYAWLTYRLSYLHKPTQIPWKSLTAQFGSQYSRPRAFKAAFGDALEKVKVAYTEANVTPMPGGLLLRPSRPHVPRCR